MRRIAGEICTCSRDVTVVYYLTKEWQESDGGVLVDLQTGDSLPASRSWRC